MQHGNDHRAGGAPAQRDRPSLRGEQYGDVGVSFFLVDAPPGVPHKHVNTGSRRARHIDIHTSGRMETAWLED